MEEQEVSTAAFQIAQHRLNLVKRNAHEIVGVKREQVHRVVENFSRPGEYVITVHRDGKVEHHTWVAPSPELLAQAMQLMAPESEVSLESQRLLTPEPQSEQAQLRLTTDEPLPATDENAYAATEIPGDVSDEVISGFVSERLSSEEVSAAIEDARLADSEANVPTAPESPAAANPAPRRRGRPKKS